MCKVWENCNCWQVKSKIYTEITDEQLKLGEYYSINGIHMFKFDKTRKAKHNIAFEYNRKCRMIIKNEFTMEKVLLTSCKKHYASLQTIQEGNMIPKKKK